MPWLGMDALCDVGNNHSKTYQPPKMNSPLGIPSSEASRRHPSTLIGLNTLQYLSRGLSHPGSWFPHRLWVRGPHKALVMSETFLSTWFPRRLESEDHTRRWFYPKLSFPHPSSWFHHRLGSEDHAIPWFYPKLSFLIQVVGFTIGLGPRTMQYLGSVQNLVFSSK